MQVAMLQTTHWCQHSQFVTNSGVSSQVCISSSLKIVTAASKVGQSGTVKAGGFVKMSLQSSSSDENRASTAALLQKLANISWQELSWASSSNSSDTPGIQTTLNQQPVLISCISTIITPKEETTQMRNNTKLCAKQGSSTRHRQVQEYLNSYVFLMITMYRSLLIQSRVLMKQCQTPDPTESHFKSIMLRCRYTCRRLFGFILDCSVTPCNLPAGRGTYKL